MRCNGPPSARSFAELLDKLIEVLGFLLALGLVDDVQQLLLQLERLLLLLLIKACVWPLGLHESAKVCSYLLIPLWGSA